MAKPMISPAQLMQMARMMKAKQSGQESQQLEELAKTGLSAEQQAQLHSVMQDKAKLTELMNSPQARELMKKMGGKQAE